MMPEAEAHSNQITYRTHESTLALMKKTWQMGLFTDLASRDVDGFRQRVA